jgi:hypothetical protein
MGVESVECKNSYLIAQLKSSSRLIRLDLQVSILEAQARTIFVLALLTMVEFRTHSSLSVILLPSFGINSCRAPTAVSHHDIAFLSRPRPHLTIATARCSTTASPPSSHSSRSLLRRIHRSYSRRRRRPLLRAIPTTLLGREAMECPL